MFLRGPIYEFRSQGWQEVVTFTVDVRLMVKITIGEPQKGPGSNHGTQVILDQAPWILEIVPKVPDVSWYTESTFG